MSNTKCDNAKRNKIKKCCWLLTMLNDDSKRTGVNKTGQTLMRLVFRCSRYSQTMCTNIVTKTRAVESKERVAVWTRTVNAASVQTMRRCCRCDVVAGATLLLRWNIFELWLVEPLGRLNTTVTVSPPLMITVCVWFNLWWNSGRSLTMVWVPYYKMSIMSNIYILHNIHLQYVPILNFGRAGMKKKK